MTQNERGSDEPTHDQDEPKDSQASDEAAPHDEPLSEDEVVLIGDLGNDFDDPDELWMERQRYWEELERPQLPTRDAWLRHRARECLAFLRWPRKAEIETRPPDEEWIRLFEAEVGPLPRRERFRDPSRSAFREEPKPDPESRPPRPAPWGALA